MEQKFYLLTDLGNWKSFPILILAEELEISIQVVPINVGLETKHDNLLKHSPLGSLPTLLVQDADGQQEDSTEISINNLPSNCYSLTHVFTILKYLIDYKDNLHSTKQFSNLYLGGSMREQMKLQDQILNSLEKYEVFFTLYYNTVLNIKSYSTEALSNQYQKISKKKILKLLTHLEQYYLQNKICQSKLNDLLQFNDNNENNYIQFKSYNDKYYNNNLQLSFGQYISKLEDNEKDEEILFTEDKFLELINDNSEHNQVNKEINFSFLFFDFKKILLLNEYDQLMNSNTSSSNNLNDVYKKYFSTSSITSSLYLSSNNSISLYDIIFFSYFYYFFLFSFNNFSNFNSYVGIKLWINTLSQRKSFSSVLDFDLLLNKINNIENELNYQIINNKLNETDLIYQRKKNNILKIILKNNIKMKYYYFNLLSKNELYNFLYYLKLYYNIHFDYQEIKLQEQIEDIDYEDNNIENQDNEEN